MKFVSCDFIILSVFTGVLPKYFSSEWSVAQFRLQEGLQYIVAFGHQKNTIVILGMDGRYVSSASYLCSLKFVIICPFVFCFWKWGRGVA